MLASKSIDCMAKKKKNTISKSQVILKSLFLNRDMTLSVSALEHG